MPPDQLKALSRRERQIIEALYRLEQASVQDVLNTIDKAPSYSTVRALLSRMVEKNLINYRKDGNRYVYFPKTSREDAAETAINKLVRIFFNGSASAAVTALLGSGKNQLTPEQLQEIEQRIAQLKQK